MSTAAAAALSAGPAAAQQSGLVNVDLSNNTVQVPIAVAANVCGLQVGVLAQQLRQAPVNCQSGATSATMSRSTGGGGTANQQGLVNLAVTGNTVQIPVGIAANICGVQAGVLASQLTQTGTATCNAVANPTAGA